MADIMAMVKKFMPLAAVVGYLIPYSSKGFDRILVDLSSITIDKLQSKWQNIAIAAGCGIALHFMKSLRLPANMQTLIGLGLWALIGYNLALTIDPPSPMTRSINQTVKYVSPRSYNPYALAGQ